MTKQGWLILSVTLIAAGGVGFFYYKNRTSKPSWETHTIALGSLSVRVTENSKLESANNRLIRSRVQGLNTINWIIESGTYVEAGDLIATFDSSEIEDQVHQSAKSEFGAQSETERLRAEASAADMAINQYLDGTYQSDLKTREKDLAILKSNLTTAQNMYDHAQMMSERGYVSDLDVEAAEFAVTRAKLNLEVLESEIDTLTNYSQKSEVVRLEADAKATRESFKAENERSQATTSQRVRAEENLRNCEVRAEFSGLVIRPEKEAWKDQPLEAGTEVWHNQTILLMPDLEHMQVKLGIHESIIKRVRPGQKAIVTLPDRTIEAEVSKVDPVAQPAGWWTGTAVRYATYVSLEAANGLRPGTSASVEVIIADYDDVPLIPVGAVLDCGETYACWIDVDGKPTRKEIELSDTDGRFVVVEQGIEAGDQVILNPIDHVQEARTEAALLGISGE